jgi:hypothetical protein
MSKPSLRQVGGWFAGTSARQTLQTASPLVTALGASDTERDVPLGHEVGGHDDDH